MDQSNCCHRGPKSNSASLLRLHENGVGDQPVGVDNILAQRSSSIDRLSVPPIDSLSDLNQIRDNTNSSTKTPIPAQPIPLLNLADTDKVLFDTLYDAANKISKISQDGTSCQETLCQGALMKPQTVQVCPFSGSKVIISGTVTENSTPESYMREVEQFFELYFKERGTTDITRLDNVKASIQKTGFYDMTFDELEFSCKMAWRNAARCSGRIQWNKLKLFDCRHITNTDDLAEAMFEHIEYAANAGNIRSGITVTAAEGCGVQLRLWNNQYFQYAGYKMPGDQILGDPANVELTRIALQLGWTPPNNEKTRFDYLPLILSCGEENPKYYNIPERLYLDVPLAHEKYPDFANLNLRWYGIPAVSNMRLEAGGLVYKCSAFNGWYQSTEIMRDFTDKQRYNLLSEIAESFGLDTSTPAHCWMDLASVELNIAIINSYRDMGVTITDHHSGSEAFMRFMENEQIARGGCPADWVWITPPIGGSLTPVFHQEMVNYKLRPAYEYNKAPWVGFKWKGHLAHSNVRKNKLTLRCVGRALMVCYKLMKSALKDRRQCTILYATETGNSEKFALRLQRMFDQGFNVETLCMDDYDISRLGTEGLLLIVASTFGNGEAPDNGKKFEQRLTDAIAQKNRGVNISNEDSYDVLKEPKRYAVFGLGSSSYPNFCAFSKLLDNQLHEAGYNRIYDLTLGDDQTNQEGSFRDWSFKVYQAACFVFGAETPQMTDLLQTNMYKAVNTYESTSFVEGLSIVHSKSVNTCQLSEKILLTPDSSRPGTYLLKFTSTDDIKYDVGDHMAILPTNQEHRVHELISRCFTKSENLDLKVPLKLFRDDELDENKNSAKELTKLKNKKAAIDLISSRLPNCTLQDSLTHYLDIEASPSQNDIEVLLSSCECDENDRNTLKTIASSTEEYNTRIKEKHSSWFDLLNQFKSLKLNIVNILADLPILQPRFYSISSCQTSDYKGFDLTVAVLQYTLNTKDGSIAKEGLCTNYLENVPTGQDIHCFFRSSTFRTPTLSKQSIIMIAAGSGIAPFRGFWRWRQKHQLAHRDTVDFMSVYFGCRDEATYLYESEIGRMINEGVLNECNIAYSRSKRHPKKHVQDLLISDYEKLRKLIIVDKAVIYVCGDIKMATGVSAAIDQILQKPEQKIDVTRTLSRQKGSNDGNEFTVAELRSAGRYHEDIYSILV